MKNRIITAIVIIWTAAFLQSTVLGYIEIFSVRPNLMIVLMVITSLLRTPFESMAMSIGLGLCMDILTGKSLGWYGLLFMLISLPISMINEKIYRDKFVVLVSFAFGSTVVIETFFYLILFMFKDYSSLPNIFMKTVIPEAIYNSALILPLFKPISRVYSILDTLDRRRNRI